MTNTTNLRSLLIFFSATLFFTNYGFAQFPECDSADQCNHRGISGTTCNPKHIVVDYTVTIDESFVDEIGNEQEARDLAISQINEAFIGLNSAMKGYTTIEGNLVQFPNYVLPNNITHFQQITDFWKSKGLQTIKKDVNIHLSRHVSPSGRPGYAVGRMCYEENTITGIFSERSNIWVRYGSISRFAKAIAHEIMHVVGLGHVDSYPLGSVCNLCGTVANGPNYLMCTYGGDYELTNCDICCLLDNLNSATCSCYAQTLPSYPPSYVPGIASTALTITSTSTPVQPCRPGDDLVTCKIVFTNNSNVPVSRKIQVWLGIGAQTFFEPIFNQDFNNETTSGPPDNNSVIRMLGANSLERIHEIPAQGELIFTFNCRLIKDQTTNSDVAIAARAFTDTNAAAENSIVGIKIPRTISSNTNLSSLGGGGFISQPLYIKSGSLTIDQNFALPYPIKGPKLIMGPGTKLIIANNETTLRNTEVHGCQQMWNSIEVRQGSKFTVEKSFICDAQIAINARPGAQVVFNENAFTGNDIGVFSSENALVVGSDNRFNAEHSLKPAFANQNPPPQNKGFCGILAKNNTLNSTKNSFHKLQNGIVALNTSLTVDESTFSAIDYSARTYYADIVPAGTLPGSGHGVFSDGGTTHTKHSIFNGCQWGIFSKYAQNTTFQNKMESMANGVSAYFCPYANISENVVAAKKIGIQLFHTEAVVELNQIYINGDAGAVGIRAGGSDYAPGKPAMIKENLIDVTSGDYGIHLPFSQGTAVTNNHISVAGAQAKGVAMDGGYSDLVNCNTVNGSGSDGIYSLMAAWPSVRCNQTNGTSNGLHFDGGSVGKAGATVAGNQLLGHSTGLLLGAQATIGQQTHKGNRFIGVDARHEGGAFAANKSRFIVNSQEDPTFLPYPIDPAGWFIDQPFEGRSYQCVDGISCPLPQSPPEYRLTDIEQIINSIGTEGATQAWNNQVRLYRGLNMEGNPWPSSPLVTSFMSQSAQNDIGAFANMRSGIAQLLSAQAPNYLLANTLLAQNQALPGLQKYHSHEKAMNAIVLSTLGIGNEPTEAQLSETKWIAALCPITEGEAVLRARALLYRWNLELPTQVDNCTEVQNRSSQVAGTLQKPHISITPNPASTEINIKYLFFEPHQAHNIQIYDTFGRLVKSMTIDDLYGTLTIDVRDLADGVYFLNAAATAYSRSFSVPFVIQD